MGSGCVAQLVDQRNICLLSTVYWKDENKEKEAGNGQFFKKMNLSYFLTLLFFAKKET